MTRERTLDLCHIRRAIGAENSVPEEMYYPEILVRMPVMNEVQCLFASEPCKPLKPGTLYMIFLVEKNVRVERRRAGDDLNNEQISR